MANNFKNELDRRLLQLILLPDSGLVSSNYVNTRSILISKHNRLVYRISAKNIVIINLIDTRKKNSTK